MVQENFVAELSVQGFESFKKLFYTINQKQNNMIRKPDGKFYLNFIKNLLKQYHFFREKLKAYKQ